MNNLYEYGDLCNVIIRCNSERKIGDTVYQANEPYTILEDVIVNLYYKTITSDASAKPNVIATREGLPDYISISNIALTDKLMCLLAEKQSHKPLSNFCHCEAWNGEIFLPHNNITNVYIYDNEHNRVEGFTIQEDRLIGSFIDGASYLVFYNYNSTNQCFTFDTPHYGYFTLEIFGKGNQDKKSTALYIKIPAASLMSVPVFDFVSGDILHAPLQWQIIHRGQEQSYFHIGE